MGTSAGAVQAQVGLPPVLCYHRVGGPLELGVTRVARAVFERQMRAVARSGWGTLTLKQFSDALAAPSSVPRDRFLLTFDDGYASLADFAYPVLASLAFTATTFLITDFIGRTTRGTCATPGALWHTSTGEQSSTGGAGGSTSRPTARRTRGSHGSRTHACETSSVARGTSCGGGSDPRPGGPSPIRLVPVTSGSSS